MVGAPVERLGDAVVIGRKDRLPPLVGRALRDVLIAGNLRRLADWRNRTRHGRRPVAVDHES
jgi:hypothetical protein